MKSQSPRPWRPPIRRNRAPEGVGSRPDTCLYYPYYEIRDQVWVKEALLYWDKVATIVPLDVDPAGFRNPLYRQLADHEVVEAWPVSSWLREQAATRVLQLLDDQRHTALPDGPPFQLNFGKLSGTLLTGLADRGISATKKGLDLEVDFQVGTLVMCTLCHLLGEKTRSRAVTDELELADAYFSVLGPSSRAKHVQEIVSLDMEMSIPDLRDIDLGKWLDFRAEHHADLMVYRDGVNSLARELAGADDESEARAVMDSRQQLLQDLLNRGIWRKLTTSRTITALSVVLGLPTLLIDPAVTALYAGGVASTSLSVKQLLHREVHGLTFVQKLRRKFG